MLKEKFNALIDELENVDNRIKKLEEEKKELQKLVDEGCYKSFNTDTHCLIERAKLHDMMSLLEDVNTYDTESEISNARSSCEEAEYTLDSITCSIGDTMTVIQNILKDTKVVKEEKKTKAIK